jgi:hypothetical protein
MNHYYRFFIQALRNRKISYGSHVDQMLKDTPYGIGITRDTKLGLHWGMANTTKRLKRNFSSPGNPQKPPTNSDSSGGSKIPLNPTKMDESLEEFLAKMKEFKDSGVAENPEAALNNYMKDRFASLALVNSGSLAEVENILKDQQISNLSLEEISLFVFYLGNFDGVIQDPHKVDLIISQAFVLIQKYSDKPEGLNFFEALGVLSVKKGVKITVEQVQLIQDIFPKLPVTVENVSAALKILTYLLFMNGYEQQYCVTFASFLKSGAEDILLDMNMMAPDQINEILYFCFRSGYDNENFISRMIGKLLKLEIEPISAATAIIALNQLKYKDEDSFRKLFSILIKNHAKGVSALHPNELVKLLEAAVANNVTSISLEMFFDRMYANLSALSIDGYLDTWRVLATIVRRKVDFDISKPMSMLKNHLKGQNWNIKDFEPMDFVSILSDLVIIRDKDMAFAHIFIQEAFARNLLKTCSGLELFMFTKLLYSYSKFYEEAFVDAHNICSHRMKDIPPEYRATLKEAFSLRKDLIPNSPFYLI